MASCFFIGHRDAPDELRPLLAETVERYITLYGVTEFIVGHYGRFDAMAASAVRAAKKQHPEVKLMLLIPYYPPPYDTSCYDCTYYPEGMEKIPKPYVIVRANEHMIKSCSYLICYCTGLIGKTRDFLELACQRERKGLMHITNLAEQITT